MRKVETNEILFKRLTKQKWSNDIDLTQELGYSYIYEKLYELENLLENGRLLGLPCKVGDTVYCLIAQGRYGTVYTTGEAIARVVSKIIWDGKRFEIYSERPHYWDTGYSECTFYGYWGESVFATKEAAEAELKKMREKK
jgi:hypothetical protein